MTRTLRAFECHTFHGYGMEASLQVLKENLSHAEEVELFPAERIAYLNIRFGELFHRCEEGEWQEFLQCLASNGIAIEKRPKRSRWMFWKM